MTAVPRTPADSLPVATDDSLAQLEFHLALDLVAGHAVSEMGAERIRGRRPSSDVQWVREAVNDVEEMMRLAAEADPVRPVAIPGIGDALDMLTIPDSVLEGDALARVGRAVAAMRDVAAQLAQLGPAWPRVGALRREAPSSQLAKRLGGAFEPDGQLRDAASPALARARKGVRAARARLVRFLEQYLRDLPRKSVAQDAQATIRSGRYVVPIRREAGARHQGIVHGESGTGATLFVEPADAVPLGNDLARAEAEEARAVLQVLRELSHAAREELPAIREGVEMCVALDDLHGRAAYARANGAEVPAVREGAGALVLDRARHPLLLVDLPDMVPFALDTGPDAVVVVSGPNTGGKTVLLKTVGLVAALLQSGVLPPVGRRSTVPVFSRIFTDIGDKQSISESLSTFSGHLRALKEIVDSADDRSLVLLDELGTGTDPVEGAALAGAVIRQLAQRRAMAIATTHLGQLKDLAVRTEGAVNASLQFDPDRLEPTYRFSLGVPGRSYGLAIARRLGFDDHLLQDAHQLMGEHEQTLEGLLANLEAREHQLAGREAEVAERQERLAAREEGLERLQQDLAAQHDDLLAQRRELETQGREEARRYLLEARRRVDEALRQAGAASGPDEAKAARRVVETAVREEGDALSKLRAHAASAGWKIKGEEIGAGSGSGSPVVSRRRRPAAAAAEPSAAPIGGTDVDLRGMTQDEAELVVLRAMDGAVMEDLPSIRIIHGKGTGALKERVTEILRKDRRVASFRAGTPTEGSWGVTVAEFKR